MDSQEFLLMAQALVEVAQEHFAFFSADGIDGEPLSPGDVHSTPGEGEEADVGSPLEARMRRMEDALLQISRDFKNLAAQKK
jgi:hypothetical protein